MGVFPPEYVSRVKARGIPWFAIASTLAEAKIAADAGADAIVVQGAEAGGHRAASSPLGRAELVGLFSLLPAVVDAVDVPVVATGGIADARGVAAAFALGASAVQIGTGFLRCPEAKINPAWPMRWHDNAGARGDQPSVQRAPGSKRGHGVLRAATADDVSPAPAPYPVQRGLTALMRTAAGKSGDLERMQAWAGQSAALAQDAPAGELVRSFWEEAQAMLA